MAIDGSARSSSPRRVASLNCQGCKTIGSFDAEISSHNNSTRRSFSEVGRFLSSLISTLMSHLLLNHDLARSLSHVAHSTAIGRPGHVPARATGVWNIAYATKVVTPPGCGTVSETPWFSTLACPSILTAVAVLPSTDGVASSGRCGCRTIQKHHVGTSAPCVMSTAATRSVSCSDDSSRLQNDLRRGMITTNAFGFPSRRSIAIWTVVRS